MHHNLFADMVSAPPRVRFGQVHVHNNLYLEPSPELYQHSWGVGVGSTISATNIAFVLGGDRQHVVDLLAAYNAAHDLSGDAGWVPTLVRVLRSTSAVPVVVEHRAGAGVVD